MKKIKIKKIAAVEGGLPAIEFDKYVPGTDQTVAENKSLPIEYEIEGELLNPIEVGKSVKVFRTKRNGVEASGMFSTSPIVNFNDTQFVTANSVYHYQYF